MEPAAPFPISSRSSLVARSLTSVVVLLVLIQGAALYFNIITERQDAYHDLTVDSRYVSHIATEALKLPLWNLDNKQALLQLSALKNMPNFCGGRVTDNQGEIFADVDFPKEIIPDHLIQREDIYFNNPTKQDSAPERLGTLEFCVSTLSMQQKLQDNAFQQLYFTGVISAAILAACYISLLILLRPLKHFREAMQRVAKKLEPLTDRSLLKQNEIGALAASFNRMIIDLSRSYNELHAAKEAAEKADMAKTNFLSNMTHELRTPLNSVIGMTNLLRERKLGADEQEMLGVVAESSDMLLDIVNDILDISKIEAGEIRMERIGFDIDTVIKRVVSSLSPLAAQKNLYLSYDCEKQPPFLLGDPLRIGQIFTNLISNAIKYTEHGSVQVQLSYSYLQEDWVELHCQVIDTGTGIPQEKLGHIFSKFSQGEASDTRRYGGSGLGLAISSQLVELMHGSMGVNSTVGEGSIFWFSIAFQTTQSLHLERRSPSSYKATENLGTILPAQAKILVAEDHPLNQMLMRRLLSKYGFVHVQIVDEGNKVLEATQETDFDLVLMDCYMPQPNGYETTRMIRAREKETGKHLPVIATTANAMIGDEQKCFAAGMDDYIPKPIIERDFVATLSQWIKFDAAMLDSLANKEAAAPTYRNQPVNLTAFKEFTRGDKAIEMDMIRAFVAQSERSLADLREACVDGYSEAWIEITHSLKGGAGGVGAEPFRLLCERAQLMANVTAAARSVMLANIIIAYNQVKRSLQEMGYI